MTWQNLGYRLGQLKGSLTAGEIDAVYNMLRERYRKPWNRRMAEDLLLWTYWKYCEGMRGRLYVEVPLGAVGDHRAWQQPCGTRRLDGVRLVRPGIHQAIVGFALDEFCKELTRAVEIELIEAKKCLNRGVIGQVIAGRELFEQEYGVPITRGVVLCRKSDAALEWVCHRHDIRVVVVQRNGVHEVVRPR